MFLLALPLLAQKSVEYELRFDNAVHHEAEIRATFRGVPEEALEVRLSRSSPGRYALHEFAKNVYGVRAADEQGKALQIAQPDPYGWNVSGHHGTVIIEYTLFGDHVDGTYAAIDQTHAHLNMPAALVWARGFENAPALVRFRVPAGSNWRVATELVSHADGFWWAPNLEQLMDSPVEISAHAQPEWKIEDATFRLALHHLGTDQEASVFATMCKAVVLEEEGIFGSLPKYDDGAYTFLIDYLPWASFDGMEHRDSTVITGSADLKKAASREIGTVSHEFFHSWNVRRIRPRAIEPFDFDRANMSGELWFAEGFTNYYGPLVLRRAGLSTTDQFTSEMGGAVNTVLTAPGRKVHDVIEMSELAPFVDAAKSIDPANVTNTYISYYTYGEALAFGIDLTIRNRFPGKTLDDWMRAMWREHPDIDKPYTLEDLERTLGEATGDPQFAAEMFRRHIYGKEPIDYGPLLGQAGLVLRKARPGKVWLGAKKLNFSGGRVEVQSYTLRDSPLYQAGVDNGDQIVRWGGKTIKSSADLDARLAKHKPGDRVSLEVQTRAGEKKIEVTLTEDPAVELVTFEAAGQLLTPEITKFRRAWLGSKALHPLPQIPDMP
ncbi:MAG: PDZ domain-containing protein [Acidobacteriota bacterium]|nr:PDZ domain-containing protein [Acidobacteriota bacterium]